MKDTETPPETEKAREKRHSASISAETKSILARLGDYLDLRFGSLEAAYDYMQSLFSSGRVGMVAFEEVLVAQVHFCTRSEARTLFQKIKGTGPTGYLTKETFCSAFASGNRSTSPASRLSPATDTAVSRKRLPAMFRPPVFLHPTPQSKARRIRKSSWVGEKGNCIHIAASPKAGSEDTPLPTSGDLDVRALCAQRTAGDMPKVCNTCDAGTASRANRKAVGTDEVEIDDSQGNAAALLAQKTRDKCNIVERASTDEKVPNVVECAIASPVFTLVKCANGKTSPRRVRAQSLSPPRSAPSNSLGTTVYFSMSKGTPPMCFFSPSEHAISRRSSLFWDSPDDVITASYSKNTHGAMVFSIDDESSLSPRSARAISTYTKTRLSLNSSWGRHINGLISPLSAHSANKPPIFPRITDLIAETDNETASSLNGNAWTAIQEHDPSRETNCYLVSSPTTRDVDMTSQDVTVSQALSDLFANNALGNNGSTTKAVQPGTAEVVLLSPHRTHSLHDTPSSSNSADRASKDDSALSSSPTSRVATRCSPLVESPLNPIITPTVLPQVPAYDRPNSDSENIVPSLFLDGELPTRVTPPPPSISSYIPDELSDCLDDELDRPPSKSSDATSPTATTPSRTHFTWGEGELEPEAPKSKLQPREILKFRSIDCSSDELSTPDTSTQSRVYVQDGWSVLKDAPCNAAQRVCDLSVLQFGGHAVGSETCVVVPQGVDEDHYNRSMTCTGENADIMSARSRYVRPGMRTSLKKPDTASPFVNEEPAGCGTRPHCHKCATTTVTSKKEDRVQTRVRHRIPRMAYKETVVRAQEDELPSRSIHIPLPAFQNPMQLRMYLHKNGHNTTMQDDGTSDERLPGSELPFNLILFVQSKYLKCKTMLTMLDHNGLQLNTMTASGQCSRQYVSLRASATR
eukprot:GEMP01006681.1.p1 GENE.GEMP01006681.1~~GEMP01006681.1.p1  ORF type:complete len:944 (+),score=168.31 GEMP01006681.1:81-2834(+)